MFSTHTHKNISNILILILTVLLNASNVQAQCTGVLESDSLALVDFYYAVGGDLLEQNGGWLEAPVSEWYGITLSDDSCSVKEINLSSQGLQGSIPDLNLPNLEILNLSGNQFSGTIPDFNLPNLEVLNLSGNQFSGTIPDFNLPKLKQ